MKSKVKLITGLKDWNRDYEKLIPKGASAARSMHGVIPDEMDELTTLPGVGRKCANVILSECFQRPSLAVDTHVSRIARRLYLAFEKDSVETIERKLKQKFPKDRWIASHHQMIFFGRYLCHARNPECSRCPFTQYCRYYRAENR